MIFHRICWGLPLPSCFTVLLLICLSKPSTAFNSNSGLAHRRSGTHTDPAAAGPQQGPSSSSSSPHGYHKPLTSRRPAFAPLTTTTSHEHYRSTNFSPFFGLFARKSNDDDEDVPDDWKEDEIVEEFGDFDLLGVDDDDDDGKNDKAKTVDDDADDDITIVVGAKKGAAVSSTDDDDDEIDLDEIDLDEVDLAEIGLDDEEDDDDDELSEEIVGEFAEDWDNVDGERAVVPVRVSGDEDEDEDEYELDDDLEDPNYMLQKKLVEAAIEASVERAEDEAFDPEQYMVNEMSDEVRENLDRESIMQEVEERVQNMMLTEGDVEMMEIEDEVNKAPDMMLDEPYPRHEEGEENFLEAATGITDDMMEDLDNAYKEVTEITDGELWDKVKLKDLTGWDGLSDETLEEMDACLGEIGGSAYNVTRWLLYDLDFNVTNLILSAVKHNREAPVLFQHWYPQLVTYKRYQHARDINFDFTWQDVENADVEELERYYAGFGYKEIPLKAPADTGIISLEDLDEEEIKMAAFENWMIEVYNPEWDRKDFDDDDMQDEDNVFSDFYEAPNHPDLPTMEDAEADVDEWNVDIGDEKNVREYRDMMGKKSQYKVVHDKEFDEEFRGHLVIACSPDDADLEVAEKITTRFESEFGKKVFVETRVMALARDEDNVFEIWLESYEVDLLHSKKRATSNTQDWNGPETVDAAQLDHLVERVSFLISDDSRYSYTMEAEFVD